MEEADSGVYMESAESFEAHIESIQAQMTALGSKIHSHIGAVDAAEAAEAAFRAQWLEAGEALGEEVLNFGTDSDSDDDAFENVGHNCPNALRTALPAPATGARGLSEADYAATATRRTDERGWRAEAVLKRKTHNGVLFYKVKWHNRNFVSWERDVDIDNRAAVAAFERVMKGRSLQQATSKRRLRPVTYVSARRLRRMGVVLPPDAAVAGVWSCELEPLLWIPYDDEEQRAIDTAYRKGDKSVPIAIGGRPYTIDFTTWVQLGGAAPRPVKRIALQRVGGRLRRGLAPESGARVAGGMGAVLSPAHIEALSIEELRLYLMNVVDFTPLHYEALMRLHELDRVVVTAPAQGLASMRTLTFAALVAERSSAPAPAGEGAAAAAVFAGAASDVAAAAAVAAPAEVASSPVLAAPVECFVCLEDFGTDDRVSVMPRCGHVFHAKCATSYFGQYSKYCPVCKAEF